MDKTPGSGRDTRSLEGFSSRDHISAAVVFVLLILFILAKVQVFRLDAVHGFPDTASYMRVASEPLASRGFWAGERPPTLPLLYKILGVTGSPPISPGAAGRIALVQLWVSIVAWAGLAGAFASCLRGRVVGMVGFGTILAFGLTMDVSQWDKMLLSESLSTSLFVAMVGLWFLVVGHWDYWRSRRLPTWLGLLGLTGLVTVLYSFSRDPNAFFLLSVAGMLALLVVIRRKLDFQAGVAVAVAVALALLFLAQNKTADASRRWVGPFRHVFLQRIVPNDGALAFFLDRGLPLTPAQRANILPKDIESFNRVLDNSASVKPLNGWIYYSGKRVYVAFLLMHPAWSLGAPLQDWKQLVSPNSSEYRTVLRVSPAWEASLSAILYPPSSYLVGGLALVGLLYALIRMWRQHDGLAAIPAVLILSCLPMMVVIWNADTLEIERHAAQIGMMIRLAIWTIVLLGFDRFISGRYRESSQDPAANRHRSGRQIRPRR